MSANDFVQHIAEIGAAVLVLTGATAAVTLAPFLAPVGALAGLALARRNATLEAAISNASKQALRELERHPEITTADASTRRPSPALPRTAIPTPALRESSLPGSTSRPTTMARASPSN